MGRWETTGRGDKFGTVQSQRTGVFDRRHWQKTVIWCARIRFEPLKIDLGGIKMNKYLTEFIGMFFFV